MRKIVSALLTIMLLFGFAGAASAQLTMAAGPEEVGLSGARLERLHRVMQDYIDRQELSGCVMIVARKGKIAYHETLGMSDIERGMPMKKDAIFRIASMSKPITSTAVMMLYEEGKFLLNDPISKYIPEFRNPSVIMPDEAGGSYKIVPAKREITVRNLLNHTSGISYQWSPVVGKLYHDANITHGLVQDTSTIVEKMKILAKMPLVNQPGEAWEYGLNIDVLGALVEVWSGKTFSEFLKERLFKPLGMNDTQFFLPAEKVSRLATVYAPGDKKLERWPDTPVIEGPMIYTSTYPYLGPQTYFSGGGGLTSTAEDYARFLQAMLNKGMFDGTRILSRKTVELMTTNSIANLSILGRPGFKFGLGFSVLEAVDQGSELESTGNFGWGGFWYTHVFVDPGEELIGVFMAQMKNVREPILGKFVVLATQAIAD